MEEHFKIGLFPRENSEKHFARGKFKANLNLSIQHQKLGMKYKKREVCLINQRNYFFFGFSYEKILKWILNRY